MLRYSLVNTGSHSCCFIRYWFHDGFLLTHGTGIRDVLPVIPIRLVREMLRDLVESAILSETWEGDGKEVAYQPAKDVELFTIKYLIDALEQHGVEDIPVAGSEALEKISECLRSFDETLKQSPANRLLKNI